MTKNVFAIYLELCIQSHKQIRDECFNDWDRSVKQTQIDLLQEMVDEMDGIVKPTFVEHMQIIMKAIKRSMR